MTGNLHHYYDQLTEKERDALDCGISELFKFLKVEGVAMVGTDLAEAGTDAFARCIIEARPETKARKALDRIKEEFPEIYTAAMVMKEEKIPTDDDSIAPLWKSVVDPIATLGRLERCWKLSGRD